MSSTQQLLLGEGAGGGAAPVYIEDVFSTYLLTGNASTQTITNGIDLSTYGGLVWSKNRTRAATDHCLNDSARNSFQNRLVSNATTAQDVNFSSAEGVTSVSSTGFVFRSFYGSPDTYVTWTFRKQPKFFDCFTYTGDGVSGRTVSHNLGSVPGCIIIKSTTRTGSEWVVYHQSIGTSATLTLNSTAASANYGNNISSVTSTSFNVTSGSDSNANGSGYVAYVFAHNAGGFGLTGTDNVISCGSFITDASGNPTVVNLGYEPQWILVKKSSASGEWFLLDTMRGMSMTSLAQLYANQSYAENTLPDGYVTPTATGFNVNFNYLGTSNTCIYIAIRRGPMKVPTSATTVFEPALYTGNGATSRTFTSSTVSPIDSVISMQRGGNGNIWWVDRLRGNAVMRTSNTNAEDTGSSDLSFAYQNGYSNNYSASAFGWNNNTASNLNYFFRRAPSFFDEVCYTGTGTTTNFSHNLGVVPEMLITKRRSNTGPWVVYTATTGNTDYLQLYTTDAVQTNTDYYNSTTPTASVFTLGSSTSTNATAQTFVAYLFATCAGVSKVGSYTGNGSTQTIDCGLTAGARFVLIKRTDSTGDWYVYDTARGMTVLTDPYLLLNSTAAEAATLGSVTTVSTGFALDATILTAINASGGTYIFLAIA